MTLLANQKVSEDLGKRITKETGLLVQPYRKNPITGSGFTVGIGAKDAIRVFATENTEITVHSDKKLKQFVISAKEPRRTISRDWTYRAVVYANSVLDDIVTSAEKNLSSWSPIVISIPRARAKHFVTKRGKEQIKNQIKGLARRIVRIKEENQHRLETYEKNLAEYQKNQRRRKSTRRYMEEPDKPYRANTNPSAEVYVSVSTQMIVPKSHQHFLIGKDEKRVFISQLREQPKSVKDAHRILRPKGLTRAALRQGEWFFQPATKDELKKLEKLVGKTTSWSTKLESNSRHHASVMIKVGKEKFVTGAVHDERKDRHEPIFMNKWYRVVRNLEMVQISRPSAPRNNYLWD